MSMANTIETNSTVKTTAVFSKNRKDRETAEKFV